MRIEYDQEADAVYICLMDKEVTKTVEISDSVNVDLDESGNLIGVEVIDATQRYSLSDIFDLSTRNLIFEKEFGKVHDDYQRMRYS